MIRTEQHISRRVFGQTIDVKITLVCETIEPLIQQILNDFSAIETTLSKPSIPLTQPVQQTTQQWGRLIIARFFTTHQPPEPSLHQQILETLPRIEANILELYSRLEKYPNIYQKILFCFIEMFSSIFKEFFNRLTPLITTHPTVVLICLRGFFMRPALFISINNLDTLLNGILRKTFFNDEEIITKQLVMCEFINPLSPDVLINEYDNTAFQHYRGQLLTKSQLEKLENGFFQKMGIICEIYAEPAQANEYYWIAARADNIEAMHHLGQNLQFGIGCEEPDPSHAIEWFERILNIRKNYLPAHFSLAQLLLASPEKKTKEEGRKKLNRIWDDGRWLYQSNLSKETCRQKIIISLFLGRVCRLGFLGTNRVEHGIRILTALSKQKIIEASIILIEVKLLESICEHSVYETLVDHFLTWLNQREKFLILESDNLQNIVLQALNYYVPYYHRSQEQHALVRISNCLDFVERAIPNYLDSLLASLELPPSYTMMVFVHRYHANLQAFQQRQAMFRTNLTTIVDDPAQEPVAKINAILNQISLIGPPEMATELESLITDHFIAIGKILHQLGPNKTKILPCMEAIHQAFDVFICHHPLFTQARQISWNRYNMEIHIKLIRCVKDLSIFPSKNITVFLKNQMHIIYRNPSIMNQSLLQWALVIHAFASVGLSEEMIVGMFQNVVDKFLQQSAIKQYLPLVYYALALLDVGDQLFIKKQPHHPTYSLKCHTIIRSLAAKAKHRLTNYPIDSFQSREKHQITMADCYFHNAGKRYFSKLPAPEIKEDEIFDQLPTPRISQFQRNVYRCLRNIFSRASTTNESNNPPVITITQEEIIGPLSKDIVIRVGGKIVVIEVNGPTHFVFDEKGTPYPNVKDHLHRHCLPEGVILIDVDYFEKLPSFTDILGWTEYLHTKLQAHSDEVPHFMQQLGIAQAQAARDYANHLQRLLNTALGWLDFFQDKARPVTSRLFSRPTPSSSHSQPMAPPHQRPRHPLSLG